MQLNLCYIFIICVRSDALKIDIIVISGLYILQTSLIALADLVGLDIMFQEVNMNLYVYFDVTDFLAIKF